MPRVSKIAESPPHAVAEALTRLGRSNRECANAVELDPIELRLQPGEFEIAMMNGFFGAIRDSVPDAWGRKVIDHHDGGQLSPFEYLLRAG